MNVKWFCHCETDQYFIQIYIIYATFSWCGTADISLFGWCHFPCQNSKPKHEIKGSIYLYDLPKNWRFPDINTKQRASVSCWISLFSLQQTFPISRCFMMRFYTVPSLNAKHYSTCWALMIWPRSGYVHDAVSVLCTYQHPQTLSWLPVHLWPTAQWHINTAPPSRSSHVHVTYWFRAPLIESISVVVGLYVIVRKLLL